MKRRTEFLIAFLIFLIFILLIYLALAMAGDRVIIQKFDKDYNRIGYSVLENGRESEFDREGNRTEHSVYDRDRIDHYDRDWNRQGHSEIDIENEKEDKEYDP